MRQINTDIAEIMQARNNKRYGLVFEEDDYAEVVVISQPHPPHSVEDDNAEDKSDEKEDNIEQED